MKSVLKTFLNNSFLVNLLSAAIILLGMISLFNMKRDLVPQWKINQITISSYLPGASAEQVEDFVTFPVEEAIQNFAGIDEIKSRSNEGTSRIEVKVKQELSDFEINDLFQLIQGTVTNLQNELPDDLEELKVVNEKLTDFWFSSLSVLHFDNENAGHRKWLKDFSEDLRKIPGIVKVTNRSKTPQLLIQYKIEALSRYHLTPNDVQAVIGKKIRPLPIGSFEQGENTIAVQMKGRILGLEDVKKIIVKGNGSGSLIRLEDVADIRYELPKEKYLSFTNGVPSLNVVLFKDLEADTLDTKVKVEKVLNLHNKEKAPKELKIQVTDDGPAYIERQLNVLNSNAIMGVALVTLVLLAFLGFKTSMMTTFGLPLAYFATFIVLDFLGIKIDIISVVGMILILGILVDDAIIVSEQYMQFLEEGMSPYKAAYEAASQTFVPILGTVLTTVVAFSPILMANDGLSNFLRAIPWVVFAALGMSLIESFLILPNHLAHFVKKPVPHKEAGVFQRSKRGYEKALRFSLKWRYPLIALFVVFAGFSFWFATEKVPFKFNLRIGSEKIRIVSELKESDSLANSEKKLKPLFDLLSKIDPKEYSHIEGNIGWSWISGEEFNGNRYANVAIRFNQTHPDIEGSKQRIMDLLNKELPSLKTDDFHRLEVNLEKSGHEKAKDHTVAIKVLGKEQVDVEKVLQMVDEKVGKLEETKSVYVDPKLMIESWDFDLNERALKDYDIDGYNLSDQLRQFITKKKIKDVRFKGESIEVLSYFKEADDLTFKELQELNVIGARGRLIPLKNLGTWSKKKTLRTLSHQDLKRTYQVDVRYDDSKIKKEKFIEKIKGLVTPLGDQFNSLQFEVEDADKESKENKESIGKMAIFCVLLIFLVLAVVLSSLMQPLLICAAIPFGVVGVIWAFYFHGLEIDVMAIVGIIGMSGVVVNDSLIMVDTINKLTRRLGGISRDLIVDGALSRLRPILLTSITTLGGVFPMAYGIGGDSGFTKPLALAMGWGLFLATFLTLFLIPAMLTVQQDLIFFARKMFYRVGLKKRFTVNSALLEAETLLEESLILTESENRSLNSTKLPSVDQKELH